MHKFHRRRVLLGFVASGAALAAYACRGILTTPALAETRRLRRTRYSDYQTPGRYKGKQVIEYETAEAPGTIIIETAERALYLIEQNGKATAYGIGVGRTGFRWSGIAEVGRKAEWPAWHPPKEMVEREWRRYGRRLPEKMEGGPQNPLGARALYLFEGEKDTLYRIHGTNSPRSIGGAVSSGCIRMLNEEVIDLYDNVQIGTKVIVR